MINKNKILVILPSKGRPNQCKAAVESWRSTQSGYSDLVVCTVEEWWDRYDKDGDVMYFPDRFNDGIGKVCNAAYFNHPGYSSYMFAADDLRFRTPGWDKLLLDAIDNLGGTGVVYGNDLLRGKRLATHWCCSEDLLRAVGFFCLPVMRHM